MNTALLIIGYLAVGWLTCLVFLDEKYDEDIRLFYVVIVVWPTIWVVYVAFAVHGLNRKLRSKFVSKTVRSKNEH